MCSISIRQLPHPLPLPHLTFVVIPLVSVCPGCVYSTSFFECLFTFYACPVSTHFSRTSAFPIRIRTTPAEFYSLIADHRFISLPPYSLSLDNAPAPNPILYRDHRVFVYGRLTRALSVAYSDFLVSKGFTFYPISSILLPYNSCVELHPSPEQEGITVRA